MKKNMIVAIYAIALSATMTAVMTGCSKDEAPKLSISIDAQKSTLTRATATAFAKDDQVSIYAWTGSNTAVTSPLVVDNSVNTYDGTQWTAAPQMLWTDDATPHYFVGVHPVKAITNFTADTYPAAIDLLVATVLGDGRSAADGVVPLVFDHLMARLDVNITLRNQFDGALEIKSVTVDARPGAQVNYLTKTATASGTAAPIALTVLRTNAAYTGIVTPQAGVTAITVRIGGQTYVYTHPTDITLEASKYTTVNLIVGRDVIELGSITINDWTPGITIDGGEAEEKN